jgi:small subunit ribosomal protein S6
MRRYETIYIANPNLEDEAIRDVITKFSDLIKKQRGSVVKIDEWGKRKLAYEVKRFDKGHYVLLDFCGFPEMVTELERNLKLDERILKYSTVKIDEGVDPAELTVEEGKKQDNGGAQVEENETESVDVE